MNNYSKQTVRVILDSAVKLHISVTISAYFEEEKSIYFCHNFKNGQNDLNNTNNAKLMPLLYLKNIATITRTMKMCVCD